MATIRTHDRVDPRGLVRALGRSARSRWTWRHTAALIGDLGILVACWLWGLWVAAFLVGFFWTVPKHGFSAGLAVFAWLAGVFGA